MQDINANIINNIRTQMLKRNWTYKDLAKATGFKTEHIKVMLTAQEKIITVPQLSRIAAVFHMRMQDLFLPDADTCSK